MQDGAGPAIGAAGVRLAGEASSWDQQVPTGHVLGRGPGLDPWSVSSEWGHPIKQRHPKGQLNETGKKL